MVRLLYVRQFCRPLDPKLLYVQQFHIPNQIRLPPDTTVEVRKQLYVPQFRTSIEVQQFVEARTDLERNVKLYEQQFCHPPAPRTCCTYNSFSSPSKSVRTVEASGAQSLCVQQFRTSSEVSTIRGGTNGFVSECETVVRKTVLSPTVSAVRGSTSGSGSECETVLRTTVLSSTSAPKLLYVQQFDIPNQFRP